MPKRSLGSVVKEAQDDARMTQRELATALGVKASQIAYIENSRPQAVDFPHQSFSRDART